MLRTGQTNGNRSLSGRCGWPGRSVLTLPVRLMLCAVLGVSGCGGGGSSSADRPGELAAEAASKVAQKLEEKTDSAETSGTTVESTPPATGAATTATPDRKFLGDVPYDVWFEDPLTIATDQMLAATPTAPAEGGMATTPTMEDPGQASPTTSGTMTEEPPAVASTDAAGDWQGYISAELLQEETKRIRNQLKTSLQGQGTYNGNFREIQSDGAVLAALAGILLQHPESLSWKERAPYVRELGQQISAKSIALGKDAYEQTQAAYESVDSVLDGSTPPGMDAPPATRVFAEVAGRAPLMRRIEKGFEWLRANITTDKQFKAETEQILREAAVIAALGKVVTLEGYESTDEADYQTHALKLLMGAKWASDAVTAESFDKFTESISLIQKSCSDCHNDYGTSN